MDKKVSVLIPVYNQAELIVKCINSIPKREDIEIIVVNDCSTDNTANILKQFNNIKVITNETNKGVGICRNILITAATGKYIFFLDSDDFIYSDVFIDVIDNELKDQNILMPRCIRNDGFIWYPGVHRGDFLKRSFISAVSHKDMRCGEDSDFRNSVRKLPGYKLDKTEKIVYHYNEPRMGSLTWENRKKQGAAEYQAGIEEWEKIRWASGEVATEDIDLVVPYVDSADPIWQKLFMQYSKDTGREDIDAINRFRGQGDFFKFFFRCIDKNAPWIRKIHLIVQSKSQVPTWLDRSSVHIVYHKDIIPEKYLPIFNSTAIEMFVSFIDGLSEKFLYANDDIFIFNPVVSSEFFDETDKVKTDHKLVFAHNRTYYHHIKNSYTIINGPSTNNKYFAYNHTIRPYLKSKCIECFNTYKNEIEQSISMFRSEANFNMYLYDNYLKKLGLMTPGEPSNTIISSSQIIHDCTYLKSDTHKILCLEDTSTISEKNIYTSEDLVTVFLNKFNTPSKYEIGGTINIATVNYNRKSDNKRVNYGGDLWL